MAVTISAVERYYTVLNKFYNPLFCKLYLHKDARGTGLGKQLLNKAMDWAKEFGYQQVYLESMPELSKAVTIYENVGFERINQPLGNSGHCGCDIWMVKSL